MKTDVNGCSTCKAGSEQYERHNYRGKPIYQYDFRFDDGTLFSCVGKSLKDCRAKRDLFSQNRKINENN